MTREGYKTAGWRILGLIAFTMALGTAGCGEGSNQPTTAAIDLKSSGVQANGELKPSVRCGWGSLWIPLEWGEVPAGAKELAIYFGRFKYAKENGGRKVDVQFAYLASKFKPSEHQLPANVLPADVNWSYFGTNCVSNGKGQHVLLEVFALDRIRNRTMNRSLATRLTEEALADPNPTDGPRSPGELTEDAAGIGRLTTTYTGPH